MSGDNVVAPPAKKLRRPVEEVRAELLADADVKEQARLLKVPLADYVEKIIDYALNPEKPPQIQIVPDEELKAKDPNVPTIAEVEAHLQGIIDGDVVISRAHQRDGFSDSDSDARYKAALGSDTAPTGAPEKRQGPDKTPKN
ncbi:hypothetical protein A176_002344 [Myxococcus hansupus]|uniref:Uncharacterized protein n=1 Tax=Pseudomyxococcus hansupus TaxID=1297742 RepID=A0A0H4XBV5_9BACT|nr:hypothetical protein [Myxococcus hansupus]AKQ65432.1 hypothetical protein A176_002344 [Myxococcus hansupus]